VTDNAIGWIADSKWGRMKTIQVSIAVAMFGHIIIIISSIPAVLKHPSAALGVFSLGLVFFGIGVGGFKPNVCICTPFLFSFNTDNAQQISPLYAEQLEDRTMRVEVRKGGERVIVDPAMTTQRMFLYFYGFINIGSIVGQVGMVYAERYVGFWLSFLLPTLMFCACPVMLAVMAKKYKLREPTGSVFGKFTKLTSYAMKNGGYKRVGKADFWERVKPSQVQNKPKWMTFDDAWVDEISRGVKACSVFAFYPLWWLAYNQIDGNLISQAATMDLHGTPNDLLNNMNPLGIIIMIPLMDFIVYPALRKYKIRFTPLRRMLAGFFVAMAAMIWAAVLQHYIYKKGACGNYMSDCETTAPINVWAQTGAYVLVGLAEILSSITGLEYAYTKAPANMRSLVFGFYNCTNAISAAIGQAFVVASADPYLVYLYGSIAVITFVTGCMFWWFFTRPWDKEEEEMNMLQESGFRGNRLRNDEEKTLDDVSDHGVSSSGEARPAATKEIY
jgi:POT family proton-dependent oligopeptide transporter